MIRVAGYKGKPCRNGIGGAIIDRHKGVHQRDRCPHWPPEAPRRTANTGSRIEIVPLVSRAEGRIDIRLHGNRKIEAVAVAIGIGYLVDQIGSPGRSRW